MSDTATTRTITTTITAREEDFRVHVTTADQADNLIGLLTHAGTCIIDSITETRRYRLHVGMTGMQFLRADHRVWQADGDGWNSWGEDPLVDSNDAVTAHVMWREPVTPAEAQRIVSDAAAYLRPMTTARDLRVVAVLSDWGTWSEDQDVSWLTDDAGNFFRQELAWSTTSTIVKE